MPREASRALNNRMIYLDNSATTEQHPKVTAKMLECMEQIFGNPSSLHRVGLDAEKVVKEARGRLSRALWASSATGGTIAFTSGGTEADNMAILGAAKAMKRRGNRIVTTAIEHPAVLECMKRLEEEGFEVIRLGVDRQGRLDPDALDEAIDQHTILVSIMHINNEVGTVMPVREAGEAIKKKGSEALLHCDAVQSFARMDIPGAADLISLSGHKIAGPMGSGALWITDGVNLPPFILGGGQEGGLRSGTENVPAIAGFGEAAELMTARRDDAFDKAKSLREKLLAGLMSEIDDVVLNGPEEVGSDPGFASPYILNVSFMGTRGEVILHTLEQDGIYVSTGSACSSNKKGRSHVLAAMGLTEKESEGAIRFSFCPDNTMEEIEETVERTADAVRKFRKLGSFR